MVNSFFVLALLLTAVGVACGGGRRQAAETSVPPITFAQEMSIFDGSRFRATYDVDTSSTGATSQWHVTWYKDASIRQRFDLSGPVFDGQQQDLMIFSREGQLIVCGIYPDTGKGFCGVDSVVALTLLNLLGFESTLTPWTPKRLGITVASDGQPVSVSDRPAACYSTRDTTSVITPEPDEPDESIDLCFASGGTLVKRATHTNTFNTTFTISGDISTPSDKDFDLPYDLTVRPTPTS